MIVCDICGMSAGFESVAYLTPSETKNMSLCSSCYKLLEEEKRKKLAEATQKVIEIRAAQAKKEQREKNLIDLFLERLNAR